MKWSEMRVWKSEESLVWAYKVGNCQLGVLSKALEENESVESEERAKVSLEVTENPQR